MLMLVLLVTLLHVSVLHRIAPFGVIPGTLLVTAVVVAMETGSDVGALVGFLCGLTVNVIDLDSPFGVPALLFCVTGWMVGVARDYAFPGADRVPFALVTVASVVTTGFYGLLVNAARGFNAESWATLGITVAVTALLNPLVSVAIGPLVRRVLGVTWTES
jgi:rod shape-determining protein MreD